MSARTRRHLAAVAVALAVAGGAGGCGQGVATCASDCALPDAPNDCVDTCNAAQAVCDMEGCYADFQAYLTCIGNAGTYRAVDDLCAAAARTARIDGGETSPVDASLPSATCAMASCTDVCGTDGSEAAACATGCEGTEAACSAMPTEFQSFLTCLCEAGGLSPTSPQPAVQCMTYISALASTCAGEIGMLDAGDGPR